MNIVLTTKEYNLKPDDNYNSCHVGTKCCNYTSPKYFVRGIAVNGDHIYSEDTDWEGALKYYKNFQSYVWYFGGGTVTICEYCGEWDYCEVMSAEMLGRVGPI